MSTQAYTTRTHCRICDGNLLPVLDLGMQAINDYVIDTDEVFYAPLLLTRCEKCNLVQLKDTADQEFIAKRYWYLSGINPSMIASLQDVVDNVEKRVKLEAGDTIIDIGCNDGTMISQYREPGLIRIGFDPAKNLADVVRSKCTHFYNVPFGVEEVTTPLAKAITSIAMFYDLEDPRKFIELVKKSLHPDGIWVIQFTNLMAMFEVNAYDNISHEHIEYYSFEVMKKLMDEHGLQIFDVTMNNVNGRSIRTYVSWKDSPLYPVQDSVTKHLEEEQQYMAQFADPFAAFKERCEALKLKTVQLIDDMIADGKTVALMGASNKGNTLLQYLGLSDKKIMFAGEVSSAKFGRKTVATNIPIIPEEEAIQRNPDYFLVLPWHFKHILLKKHLWYLKNGGHFIFPCPEVEIISKENIQ
jgi:cyclopropane fatty-acyl-phospholipid synthase-like methyltransferase